MNTFIGSPLSSIKSFLFLSVLIVAALFGNYFKVTLSPGIDFVFGSIAVLITVYVYGTMWGTLVAITGGVYTYFLWNHPYAAIIFAMEALFVGYILKRRDGNILLIDGLYWVILGLPLGFLFYYSILGMNIYMVLLVMLKLTVNGVFNALLANFVLTYLPFQRIIPGWPTKTGISFHTTLFNVFVGLVLVPSLILLFMQSRHEYTEMEDDIKFVLRHQSTELTNRLSFWRQQHEYPLKELASFISHHEMKPSPELQQNVEHIKKSFPELLGISVCDKNGISIAIYPRKNLQGNSAIGMDFSNQDYFIKARSTMKSYVSPVFEGRAAIAQPVIAISVPVISKGEFKGVVSGALDLSYITRILDLNIGNEPVFATVVDSGERVISSTKDELKVVSKYDGNPNGERRKIDSDIFQWFPAQSKGQHQASRWEQSIYGTTTIIGPDLAWKLIIQVPAGPFLMELYYHNIKIMITMLALVIMAVALSKLFTQWIAKPISSLASFTSHIPRRLESGSTMEWLPPSNIFEIDSLINNFRSMSDIIQANFRDLQNQYNYSSALNRLAGVIASNNDTRVIIETTNEILGKTLDVDLCLIYDIDLDKGNVVALTEWYNPKYPERLTSIHNFDLKAFARCNEYVLTNQTWIESHFDQVACCLADEVSAPGIHENLGIKSLIWYPFSFHEGGYYVLSFNHINTRRKWSCEELNFVAAAAQQVEIAIQKRELMSQLTQLAYHDALTRLPNRVLFQDRLSLALVKAKRNNEKAAVLFLDLDRFKLVNDMLGHVMGDSLLQEVASRLSNCMRQSDTIARLGGDEFILLIPDVNNVEDAVRVARKILDVLIKPFYINEHEFHVSASIGISLYPEDGDDADTLMRHADMAMYRAKEQGLNNFQLYTPEMNYKITERLSMEQALRKSMENMEFIVYYQPQVNAVTGQIEAMEALVRWKHPDRGIVFPNDFIPLAEETGLILPLGEWVLRTACAQNKAWQNAGYPPMIVSVNISACQFRQGDLTRIVAQVLHETQLEPQLLELEITESVTMKDVEFTSKVLGELKNMGVQIAIDDFGTGHSSLGYLKRFPIDTLKIDRSFIRDVDHDPEDAAIVTTIISMAKNLKLGVIAEGVENIEQVSFLVQRECEKMQGFYFSKPVSPEEFEQLLSLSGNPNKKFYEQYGH